MQDDIFPALAGGVNRLHQPATGRSAVAGIEVNVLAPETLRAVVGIAVPLHRRSASLADKVFGRTLKFLCGVH